MATETPEQDFYNLIDRARAAGVFLQRHLNFDPVTGTGDLYLMERRTADNPKPPTLLKFATASEVEDALTKIESLNK